jgi:hypothetical protein
MTKQEIIDFVFELTDEALRLIHVGDFEKAERTLWELYTEAERGFEEEEEG